MRTLRIGACLSLSGRYARFGQQAAAALEVWRDLDGAAELVIEDDASDLETLKSAFPRVMGGCDVLLGPYSTQLTRAAGRMASESGRILWNHGGSGDDIEAAFPGVMVSVLTPASRYAEPFIGRLAADYPRSPLWILQGKGSFGRQVCDGAEDAAARAGIEVARFSGGLPEHGVPARWDLFSAGTFEDDVQAVVSARRMSSSPRVICSVAAGVGEFRDHVDEADGVYGVGQWFPGAPGTARPRLGPAEAGFLAAWTQRSGAVPDYPGIQAAATAVVASHCVRQAGGSVPEAVWRTAAALDTDTMFGRFRIDPVSGTQLGHEAALVRWAASGLVRA